MRKLIFMTSLFILCMTAVAEYPAPPRKSASTLTVEVIQNISGIEIYFGVTFTGVNIKAVNSKGISVYNATTNVNAGSSVFINTVGWSTGMYTLKITDGSGSLIREIVLYHQK